jgi:hypothetical protein
MAHLLAGNFKRKYNILKEKEIIGKILLNIVLISKYDHREPLQLLPWTRKCAKVVLPGLKPLDLLLI